MEKVCKKCNTSKELEQYYKHAQMSDGHLNICIECTKARVTKHRDENIEEIREYDRNRDVLPHRVELRANYLKTEKGKKAHNKATKKHYQNNKHKRHAEQLAWRALRNGFITQQPCIECGRTDDVEMHHEDYSKPLDVIFLCPTHHKTRHSNIGEINIKNKLSTEI